MKYRRLGATGLRVSVVGLGTMQFGGEWGKPFDATEVLRILNTARDRGINFIDTAECYGDHLSESLIGRTRPGRRDEWVIATKFGHRFEGFRQRPDRWSVGAVREQLEASLRALRTDYIDLYQFHSGPDEAFNDDDLWRMLDDQVAAGKVRHLGLSIRFTEPGYQVDMARSRHVSVLQVRYNRLDREAEERILPTCCSNGLAVISRVPLASGYLTGKYAAGAVFPADDIRSVYEIDGRIQAADAIRRDEVPASTSMAQWALAWCLRHPAVATVIPGCKDPGQVQINAGAAELIADQHALA
jgi:aryl-alcohol dehydrogenase-like predicted oxidoreductase